eukprot:TRINITY_DN45431_c0_g1_i1.p2 TRINITY_DN45431_c0_g1~~TRINITY_DN45431_c0_g1_i1.p2  ORF type:complete len:264 (-),score=29.53 TRINITY_DN45431_c0_g1_i1:858-1628(-)
MLTHSTSNLLQKELRKLKEEPCPDVELCQENLTSLTEITAKLRGPENTPYEGGEFKVRLYLPPEYPQLPPKGVFLTRIFHPNVAPNGEICVNVLKREWKPDYGLNRIFQVVRCLLIEPNPESALNEEAGRLIMENFDEYKRQAALFTQVHAKVGANCLSPLKQPQNLPSCQPDKQSQQLKIQKIKQDGNLEQIIKTSQKRALQDIYDDQSEENQAPSNRRKVDGPGMSSCLFTPTKKRKLIGTVKSPKTPRSLRRL